MHLTRELEASGSARRCGSEGSLGTDNPSALEQGCVVARPIGQSSVENVAFAELSSSSLSR